TKWAMINKALDLGIPEPVETYSSSPHLFTDLNIPEGTKGRLPRSKRTRAGLDAEQVEDLGETGAHSGRRQGGRGQGGGRGSHHSGGRGGQERGQERSQDRPRRRRNRRRTRGGQRTQQQGN